MEFIIHLQKRGTSLLTQQLPSASLHDRALSKDKQKINKNPTHMSDPQKKRTVGDKANIMMNVVSLKGV